MKITNSVGMSPLHVAALAGNKDIERCLIESRADVEVRDSFGRRPVDYKGFPALKGKDT